MVVCMATCLLLPAPAQAAWSDAGPVGLFLGAGDPPGLSCPHETQAGLPCSACLARELLFLTRLPGWPAG